MDPRRWFWRKSRGGRGGIGECREPDAEAEPETAGPDNPPLLGDVVCIWELPEAGPARSDGSAGIAGAVGSVAMGGGTEVDVVQRAALVELSCL